jgi:hypothetical protein
MKVEIVSDEASEIHQWKGKNTVETIEFDGNTIMPYYINVLSITHNPDKITIRMNGKYKTRISTDYDMKTKKGNDKLWIMGIDKNPVVDGGEEQKIM